MEEITKLFEGFMGSCKGLTEKMEKMFQEIDEQNMFIKNQNEHIEALKVVIEKISIENKEQKFAISKFKEEIKEQKMFINNQNEQIRGLKELVSEQQASIEKLAIENKEQKSVIAEFKEKIKEQKMFINNQNEQIRELKDEVEKVKASIILDRDMRNKDGRPSISEEDIQYIRELRASGVTVRKIAELANVSVGVVSKYSKVDKVVKPSKKKDENQ